MSVTIGHATSDSRGQLHGDKAGNQNGRELCIRTWYNRPWDTVLRPKKIEVAENIALAMEKACRNRNIGYDQWQRTTLYSEAQKVGFDLSRILTPCECDCSSLVAVCVNAAGIHVSKDLYTGNEAAILLATGEFMSITTTNYTGSSEYLKRGDILLNTRSHTAIVLSNGPKAIGSSAKPSVDVSTYATIRYGDVGPWVLLAQNLLHARGYFLTLDSEFGPETLTQVKNFQRDRGLVVDGVVGRNTWSALVP